MKLIKRQSKQTFEKNGKKKHYYNFFIEFDNGKRVQIKANFKDDTRLLDFGAEFEPVK